MAADAQNILSGTVCSTQFLQISKPDSVRDTYNVYSVLGHMPIPYVTEVGKVNIRHILLLMKDKTFSLRQVALHPQKEVKMLGFQMFSTLTQGYLYDLVALLSDFYITGSFCHCSVLRSDAISLEECSLNTQCKVPSPQLWQLLSKDNLQ